MANVMHTHHKKTESEDTRNTNDLFSCMHQGKLTPDKDGRKGLFQAMNQGKMCGEPARVAARPGKTAKSVGRSMGQGGK